MSHFNIYKRNLASSSKINSSLTGSYIVSWIAVLIIFSEVDSWTIGVFFIA